jgi:hypothetical protein
MKKLDLTQDEAIIHMQVLRREVDILKGRLRPEDTGHIRTAIDVLQSRLDEIMLNIFADQRQQ